MLLQGLATAAAVRERQLRHISVALETAALHDSQLTDRLIVQRDSHVAPPRVGVPPPPTGPLSSSGRRSGGPLGAGGVKPFVGQTMDERKATQAAKQAMLAASFLGYKTMDGTFVQSSRVPAAAEGVGGAAIPSKQSVEGKEGAY